jgi:hypothetical protein
MESNIDRSIFRDLSYGLYIKNRVKPRSLIKMKAPERI